MPLGMRNIHSLTSTWARPTSSLHLQRTYVDLSRFIRSKYFCDSQHKKSRYFSTSLRYRDSSAQGQTEPRATSDLFKRYAQRSHVSNSLPGWQQLILPDTPSFVRILPEVMEQKEEEDQEAEETGKTEPKDLHGQQVCLDGYITSHRKASKKMSFLYLADPHLRHTIQLKVMVEAQGSENANGLSASDIEALRPHTPVQVIGTLESLDSAINISRHDRYIGRVGATKPFEVAVSSIKVLNAMPVALSAEADTYFADVQRHLLFRVDSSLRARLRKRSYVSARFRRTLFTYGFDEIETPLLFKSTSEGAREFIVPTRRKGLAYALPQSPQQYKQLLMASGVHKYFQFAKCFRDEDLRTDRQPEFTQLDLEMSFAGPAEVMRTVERLFRPKTMGGIGAKFPSMPLNVEWADRQLYNQKPWETTSPFPVMTYQEAMTHYGIDKPDLRIDGSISRVDDWLPDGLKSMLTSLKDPIVELMVLRLDADAAASSDFVKAFMDSPEAAPFVNNPEGMPGVTVVNADKPLSGLAAFGHEAAAMAMERFNLEPGNVVVLQSRPNEPFSGGSTALGRLRTELFAAAAKQNLVHVPAELYPLWVVDFPLFSPVKPEDEAPYSIGALKSTHHPFTSPVPTPENIEKLKTDPLSVVGDHFDLVINGVEVGGGSRRIHDPEMQEYIFRDVLRLPDEKVEDFRHLLRALSDGCPPHAGFAIGFDRLMAVLTRVQSIRSVMAFPKLHNGDDIMVKSPTPITPEQLKTYGLRLENEVPA